MSSHGSKIGLFLLTFYLSLAMVTSRSFELLQDNYYYPPLAGSQMYYESSINPYNQYQFPEEYYIRDQPLDDSFFGYIPTKYSFSKNTRRYGSNSAQANRNNNNKRKKGVIIPCAFNAISCFGKWEKGECQVHQTALAKRPLCLFQVRRDFSNLSCSPHPTLGPSSFSC